MEEWKTIFEDYEISNLGNCRKKGKIIKGCVMNRGYKYFQVQREGKRLNKLFHHLVAEAFIGARPDGLVIDHIDRNKLNNNVNNLRYITQELNMINQDRYRTDIETTDKRERHRIFQKEHDIKRGHSRGIKRPKAKGELEKALEEQEEKKILLLEAMLSLKNKISVECAAKRVDSALMTHR